MSCPKVIILPQVLFQQLAEYKYYSQQKLLLRDIVLILAEIKDYLWRKCTIRGNKIMFILPLMTGHLFCKATILGDLYRGVPLYYSQEQVITCGNKILLVGIVITRRDKIGTVNGPNYLNHAVSTKISHSCRHQGHCRWQWVNCSQMW